MDDIEGIINNVNGSMAIEGMPLTRDDRERLRDCLTGKVSFDETVKKLVKKHTVTKN
jgi:hypothetical protein